MYFVCVYIKLLDVFQCKKIICIFFFFNQVDLGGGRKVLWVFLFALRLGFFPQFRGSFHICLERNVVP